MEALYQGWGRDDRFTIFFFHSGSFSRRFTLSRGGDIAHGVSDDTVARKILRRDFLQRYLLVRLDSR